MTRCGISMELRTGNVKWMLPVAVLLLAACMAWSCKRRTLTDLDSNVRVNIDIDYDIVNWPEPEMPGMMRVMFFDNAEGDFASHAFLPATGGNVGVIPGRTYHVLAYNFDTESTVVGGEYGWDNIYATTNEVPESVKSRLKSRAGADEDELIVYEPDHHFVAREKNVYIPARSVDAPPVEINLHASTIVETWKVHVDKVLGMEYVAGISGVISGMAQYKTLSDGKKSESKVSVFFETMSLSPDGVLDIRFNTFGYVPSEQQVISLVVTDIAGNVHIFDFNESDKFVNNPEQTIYIVTDEIVIDKPENPGGSAGGGLAPDVDEWEDIVVNIPV